MLEIVSSTCGISPLSLADKRKEILLDISNNDTGVIDGYKEYNQYDNQTPNFLSGGCSFDIVVEPPTESADYWEIGVFASRKAIDMLRIASNRYDSATYNSIQGMSRRTDRMFYGSGDHLEVECGFLSQLSSQSYANHKYGFAHKTTNIPHSQEMMDCVYDGVMTTLFEAVEEARLHLIKVLGVGLDRFSEGGFNLDD